VIVAIDGPVAAGKTTVAKKIAARLGQPLLDTGAIYRCVALSAQRAGVRWQDEAQLAALAERLAIEFRLEGEVNHVLLAGEDVTAAIRTPEMSQGASLVSALRGVRAALLELQRRLGEASGVVAEGRDVGTVVFPGADVKIFLTATPEVRARRRHRELADRGATETFESVLAALQERDRRDTERPVAPLVLAEDAMMVDTSDLTVEQVVSRILAAVRATADGFSA
jgi:cytidylate kinase